MTNNAKFYDLRHDYFHGNREHLFCQEVLLKPEPLKSHFVEPFTSQNGHYDNGHVVCFIDIEVVGDLVLGIVYGSILEWVFPVCGGGMAQGVSDAQQV